MRFCGSVGPVCGFEFFRGLGQSLMFCQSSVSHEPALKSF